MKAEMGLVGLATAMSDSLWGVATALSCGDESQKRSSLVWMTKCLIQHDRVSSQDGRGPLYPRNYGQVIK